MTVNETVMIIGVASTLFLILIFLMYKVGVKILTSATCFKCGSTHWEWDTEYIHEGNITSQHVLFKCSDCGHVRGRYIRQIEKKE